MNYTIEEMKSYHWEEVKNIYIEGINTGIATFQTESDLPTWEEWNNNHISSCRLVACFENNILGFVALTPISNRPVYCGVAELSLYISEKYKEQGIGTALLTNLIKLSEENGYWTLQSAIFTENLASISLHKKCDFREIGIRKNIGKMSNGKWMDVVLMEKRSTLVGIS